MKLETILVPLDGSPLAEVALAEATGLARDSGARLVLLRAVEASPLLGSHLGAAEIRLVREAEEYLAATAACATSMGAKNVSTSVWYGPAPSAIAEAARVNEASLIVMTTHGRSGLGRLILGSVAEAVLRSTTAPILLLRDARAPVEPTPAKVSAPKQAEPTGRGSSR
jgi:nucleotide-binding universal stress UspA family protein